PLPVKEPSSTLFNLLNQLIQSGNQLASIAEIFVGKMPGQNTPATTTQETIQQGMAVFTAIYKRVYRSLAKEFKKIYRLNRMNPDCVAEEQKIGGIPMQSSDYDLPDWVVIPGADPTGDSSAARIAKLQGIGNLMNMGTINPQTYTQMYIDSSQIPNGDSLIAQPQPPQPDPKVATEQAKQQTEQLKQQGLQQKQQGDQQKQQSDISAKQQELQIKERMAALEATSKQAEVRHAETLQAMKLQGEDTHNKLDLMSKLLDQHFQAQKHGQEMAHSAGEFAIANARANAVHAQTMNQKDQAFQQKQKQAKLTKGKKPNKGA
ncbi:MAG: hypothetical protein ACYC9R_12760, partial [Nitrosotalea sp.]